MPALVLFEVRSLSNTLLSTKMKLYTARGHCIPSSSPLLRYNFNMAEWRHNTFKNCSPIIELSYVNAQIIHSKGLEAKYFIFLTSPLVVITLMSS